MNPFHNPVFLAKLLKRYFVDIERLNRVSEENLKNYQDKQVRKLLRFASAVPLYHDAYKKAGVNTSAVTGINDITKLPVITKNDIKHYYPSGIISKNVKKEQLIEVSTSGTTGKVLSIYVDMLEVVSGLFAYMRTLREYGMNIWKDRITIIGDFAPHTAESGYVTRGLQPRFNLTGMFKNIQWLDTNEDPKKLAVCINDFRPDFIGGYVGMLGHLALLQESGFVNEIAPRYVAATGSVLDPYLKTFIEKNFSTRVFEVYGATESGLIGFQCKQGNYHLMSDLVHAEFHRNGQPVSSGEAGEMILTKLFGRGTPIIRYNAINDIVAPLAGSCRCGMVGALIKKVYGRNDLALYLSDGTVLLPSSFSEVYSRLLYELKTKKVKNTRIIQHDLRSLEIQVVIDESQRTIGPSVSEIFDFIRKGFQKKVGPSVSIIVKEADSVDTSQGPRIISKVDQGSFVVKRYL